MIKNFYKYNKNKELDRYIPWLKIKDVNDMFEQNIDEKGKNYLKEKLIGKIIKINVYQKNYKVLLINSNAPDAIIKVKDVIILDGHNYILVDDENDKYEPYYDSMIFFVDDEKILIDFKKMKLEKEKRREENRLNHLHIDPYGEDDWDE